MRRSGTTWVFALVSALGGAMVVTAASAATIPFSDSFDGYVTSDSVLNWDDPANTIWDVTSGTVDLLQSGDFGIACHTGVGCVDLDGSTANAGILSTITTDPFTLVAGQAYSLSAWLSGSQVFDGPDDNEPNEVEFGVKTLDNVTLASVHV